MLVQVVLNEYNAPLYNKFFDQEDITDFDIKYQLNKQFGSDGWISYSVKNPELQAFEVKVTYKYKND